MGERERVKILVGARARSAFEQVCTIVLTVAPGCFGFEQDLGDRRVAKRVVYAEPRRNNARLHRAAAPSCTGWPSWKGCARGRGGPVEEEGRTISVVLVVSAMED